MNDDYELDQDTWLECLDWAEPEEQIYDQSYLDVDDPCELWNESFDAVVYDILVQMTQEERKNELHSIVFGLVYEDILRNARPFNRVISIVNRMVNEYTCELYNCGIEVDDNDTYQKIYDRTIRRIIYSSIEIRNDDTYTTAYERTIYQLSNVRIKLNSIHTDSISEFVCQLSKVISKVKLKSCLNDYEPPLHGHANEGVGEYCLACRYNPCICYS